MAKREDFNEAKEREIVEVCGSASITDSNMTKLLRESLDRRNMYAHPSGVAVRQVNAEAYITDLVNNVVLRLK